MSEIAGTGNPTTATAVVHESYSFACMRCGHGWEQSYEIEHLRDADGNDFVVYRANGQRVPSPLSQPKCLNCGHRVVRIMRAGRVSSVRDSMQRIHFPGQLVDKVDAEWGPSDAQATADAQRLEAETRRVEAAAARSIAATRAERAARRGQHHWGLSDLMRYFHRKGD
ncbi:hypothetical protein ACWCP6_08140 [Streptomyces sp. NPDC002004]